MSDFVVSPMEKWLSENKLDSYKTAKPGAVYNGEDEAAFADFKRTPSPDGVPEINYDRGGKGGAVPLDPGKDGGN